MSTFARGAKVREKPAEPPLTMVEASFVMCSVAESIGIHDEALFIAYMRKAWAVYQRTADTSGESRS
jgi:hypothetical protein